jgi:branched-chain amino acid transport system substrate-binding protein
MVMVSGKNTAPSLTSVKGKRGPNWQPGYFRTVYNDEVQGRTAATFAFQELKVSKVATINDGETDMRPVLAAVATSKAELVFFPIFEPEGNLIVLQAGKTEGLDHLILMSADGLLTNTFIEAVGEKGIGMYFAGPATPQGPAYEAFIAKFKSTYGEPPTAALHAHAYDAARLVFKAIEKVAVQDKDGTLHIGRQALRDTLYATAGYPGLTGSLACNEFGDCGAAQFNVVRLDNPAQGIEGLTANIVYTYPQKE